ncbi:repressor LexA [Opitutaceae bacterium TAV4]|nr:repressor LexA [Opitutaceae bacterium TAV4]RRK00160.1 repressor LexA [Opitutaceae bacterium TAV3]
MLTEKQESILDYMREVQAERSIPPSTRDIQKHFGYESQNAVMNHLRALARKGQIEQIDGRTWGLRARTVQGQLFTVPVYGTIPAGTPTMQEQESDQTIRIDPALFGVTRPGKRRQLWALRVSGDSMTDAHILDGDLAILERREPREGDIVAALVDDTTTTLKRLVYQDGQAILHPENKRYEDIVPENGLECQGVLVGVIRRTQA